MGSKGLKIVASADDVMIMISNPRLALPQFLTELEELGSLSGFRLNLD